MGIARRRWLGLGMMGLCTWCSLAMAGGPLDKLLTVNRVEADPQKTYALTEKNGPWMISVCSFSGDGAEQQARELVLELRKRYKLPAYRYVKKFDLGKETYGAGIDRFGNPQKMKYARGSQLQEVAVLAGNYPTVDDPEAQEMRDKLKFYEPECLKLAPNKKTTRTLAALRWFQKEVLPAGDENKKKGPMGQAFITTNPLLPKEYFAPTGLDDLVIKANDGVTNCLLDCPGKFSVQVAHFTGKVVIKPNEIKAIENGQKEMESGLAKAAYMAHRLTEALRMKGYQATSSTIARQLGDGGEFRLGQTDLAGRQRRNQPGRPGNHRDVPWRQDGGHSDRTPRPRGNPLRSPADPGPRTPPLDQRQLRPRRRGKSLSSTKDCHTPLDSAHVGS